MECVQALLGLNADMDIQDSNGRTPLHVAVTYSELEALYLLIQKGCSLALKDKFGHTAYDLCALYGVAEAKGAISSAGMIRKHMNETNDREKVNEKTYPYPYPYP